MSARVDHVSAARNILAYVEDRAMGSEQAQVLVTAAQVNATLALVEQQRIANLIALTGTRQSDFIDNEEAGYLLVGEALYSGLVETVPTSLDDEHYELRPEIKEALGLS